jgi:sterol 3beta-glucosyltransferase
MRITIFAAGSRGDIQPCVALGMGLRRAGYQVRLAVPEDFENFIREHGLDFYPLRGDVQKIMAGDTGREFMETGGSNPIKSIRAIRKMLGPIALQMAQDAYAACSETEALICLGVQGAFGKSIADARNFPMVNMEPTPLLPTRAFPAPGWPIQRDLGGLHNLLSGWLMLRVLWLWYAPFVNEFRETLGLETYTAADFHRMLKSIPMVGAYSPNVIPHPRDWPDSLHVTGYLFLNSQPGWQPPPQLEAFLKRGDPPVYVGFGSMGGRKPEELAGLAMEALAKSGKRGVLLKGWGGLRAQSVPESVFVADSVPHSWLFARVAAVVHHGGAGTTAEGLRAGVPTIIVPFAFDQAFWGTRIHALGAGPPPIPQKELTADRLAEAITMAVTDQKMNRAAEACGEAIRAEHGISNAVDVIQNILGGS